MDTPTCPICDGPAISATAATVLDCQCARCGWYFTSQAARARLLAAEDDAE